MSRCLTADGPGTQATRSTITVERCRPACQGARAEDSRDSHCSSHPLSRRAGGAPLTIQLTINQRTNSLLLGGYSSIGQSIRLSTGRLRVRLPLASFTRFASSISSGAHAVLHHPAPEDVQRASRHQLGEWTGYVDIAGSDDGVRGAPMASRSCEGNGPASMPVTCRRSSADQSTWLRTRGSGVRISPTALHTFSLEGP